MSAAPLCLNGLSCHFPMIPNLDTCCINDPSGLFLQTQFWDAEPALGGNETWTIHGLWPDLCTGGFEQFCDNSRHKSPEQITAILSRASTSDNGSPSHPGLLDYITRHWLSLDSRNSNLWAHEWNKHGTCISTLETKCYDKDEHKADPPVRYEDGDVLDYFTQAVMLYTTLPTFEFFARHGIVPSDETTYELEHLMRAIEDSSHGAEPTIRCRNHNELSEVWYHFNTRGELRNAKDLWWDGNTQWHSWSPAPPNGQVSNCPKTGIRYPPKKIRGPAPTHTRPSHTVAPTATATHTSIPSTKPFTGQGRLMVKVTSTGQSKEDTSIDSTLPIPREYTGCLIRKGTWYAAHSLTSCATFTAEDDAKSGEDADFHLFTLSSRFAPCSFVKFDDSSHGSGQQPLSADDMFFACSQKLPFQTILSNNATIDKQHTDTAQRLTLGDEHQYTFYTDKVPRKSEQVHIWDDDNNGQRNVEVEIYWESI